MKNPLFILVFVIVVFVVGGLMYVYNPDPVEYGVPKEKEPVACTMEAKLCPDGSYVGRGGPNCDFAACPDTGKPEFEDGTVAE